MILKQKIVFFTIFNHMASSSIYIFFYNLSVLYLCFIYVNNRILKIIFIWDNNMTYSLYVYKLLFRHIHIIYYKMIIVVFANIFSLSHNFSYYESSFMMNLSYTLSYHILYILCYMDISYFIYL